MEVLSGDQYDDRETNRESARDGLNCFTIAVAFPVVFVVDETNGGKQYARIRS